MGLMDDLSQQLQTIYSTLQNISIAIGQLNKDLTLILSNVVDPNGTNT